ncbi:MAG: AI-2E family transporter [Candidatus Komeilibacteria bacterium]|nr:AI-2E family transporter [Candidatus Komeilibacteria bacterium]
MANPFRDPKDSITVHVSSMSIIKVLLVFLVLAFIYLVWDIVVLLFVSLLFAASLSPAINWLETKKIPRAGGLLLIYIGVLLLISLVVVLIIPPIAGQINQLAFNFPFYYEKVIQSFGSLKLQTDVAATLQQSLTSVGQSLSSYTGSVVGTISGLFGGVAIFMTVLVLTFYFAVKKDGLQNFVLSVTPLKYQKYAVNMFLRIQDKLGMWLRGQLLLSGIIFLVTYIGLLILGVKYALVLALIAGITEAIPFIGPFIGAVPAVFLAFLQSPLKGVFVIILYIVVQQLENNIIVPKVMQKAVGLNPIVVMVAILLGAKLAGILGAILAIPVTTAAMVVAGDWFGVEETKS